MRTERYRRRCGRLPLHCRYEELLKKSNLGAFPPSGGVAVVESGSTVTLLASGGYTTIEGCDPVHYEWQDSQGNVIADGAEITITGDVGSRVFYTAVTIDACGNRSASADYVWTIAPPAVTVEPPTDPDGVVTTDPDGTVTTTVTLEDVEGTEVTITPTGGTTSSPDCEPVAYEFTAPDGTVTTGASLTVTAPAADTTDTYSVVTVDACGNTSPPIYYDVVGIAFDCCGAIEDAIAALPNGVLTIGADGFATTI